MSVVIVFFVIALVNLVLVWQLANAKPLIPIALCVIDAYALKGCGMVYALIPLVSVVAVTVMCMAAASHDALFAKAKNERVLKRVLTGM